MFVWDDGRSRVSDSERLALVESESAWLTHRHSPTTRFAVLADNGIAWAVSDLALHQRRRVNVPLPTYFSDAQLRHALQAVGVEAVLTDTPERVAALDPAFRANGTAPGSKLTSLTRDLRPEARPALPVGTSKITFTSGSTGTPKGVCLAAESIERVAESLAAATRATGATRHLCLLPLPTLLDNIASLYAAPLSGANCVIPATATTGIRYGGVDAALLLKCIGDHHPESLILVPELLRLLVAAQQRGWRAPDSLKFVAVGGAVVSPALLEAAEQARLPVYEGYGLSECASVVALNRPDARRRGSVGRVLPHSAVRIDAHGEIHVRGTTMLGYLGEAPIAGGEIATGDLGELDTDGYLYVRGRRKNVLITSLGRNLSPEWIERELTLDARIAQAVVFGDGQPRPVALLVPSAASIDSAQIAAAVAQANTRLPEHARLARWAVATAPFSTSDGTLTASGRARRDSIARREHALLHSLYALTA
jgi:long-chain acyl-CoA synthetase